MIHPITNLTRFIRQSRRTLVAASLCLPLLWSATAQSTNVTATAASGTLLQVSLAFASSSACDPDGYIYIAGGYTANNTAPSNQLQKIDPVLQTIVQLPTMQVARAAFGLVKGVDGKLYAIGGVDQHGAPIAIVEQYDPTAGSWANVAPMLTPRSHLAVVAGSDGKIYAIGGTDSKGNVVNTVEQYDPSTNTWSTAAPLNVARTNLAACLGSDNKIYVAGGKPNNGLLNNISLLNSVEVYDEYRRTWQPCSSMHTARADFGLALNSSGNLVAAGGVALLGDLNSIELYDTFNDVWSNSTSTLPAARSQFTAFESMDGTDYLLGGDNNGSQINAITVVADPAPAHTLEFNLYGQELGQLRGSYIMNQDAPMANPQILWNIFGTTSWVGFPALTGQLNSGATVSLVIPAGLDFDFLTQFTVQTTDVYGNNVQLLGQTTQFAGFGGSTINIPITAPVTLKSAVLKLTVQTLFGFNFNSNQLPATLQITQFTGQPE
jgi:hypothetical protein